MNIKTPKMQNRSYNYKQRKIEWSCSLPCKIYVSWSWANSQQRSGMVFSKKMEKKIVNIVGVFALQQASTYHTVDKTPDVQWIRQQTSDKSFSSLLWRLGSSPTNSACFLLCNDKFWDVSAIKKYLTAKFLWIGKTHSCSFTLLSILTQT